MNPNPFLAEWHDLHRRLADLAVDADGLWQSSRAAGAGDLATALYVVRGAVGAGRLPEVANLLCLFAKSELARCHRPGGPPPAAGGPP